MRSLRCAPRACPSAARPARGFPRSARGRRCACSPRATCLQLRPAGARGRTISDGGCVSFRVRRAAPARGNYLLRGAERASVPCGPAAHPLRAGDRRALADVATGAGEILAGAQRPGATDSTPIAILAHRDAAGASARAELSGTAALLELARVFAARETKRTIVLVSTSGGSGGDAGAADFAAHARGTFDAAIVLGDLAAAHEREPLVVPHSAALGSAPLALPRPP